MGKIHLLDQNTINQIAAGEVIDRPVSVVKELTENAIDAGATAITIETKQGGTSLIRVTDNGGGIASEDLSTAFKRHSTSKIAEAADLLTVSSLGFRGEALSSVAAIARVELITRTHSSLVGNRYVIEGGKELVLEEVGAPEGTTILVRDLFFNTPARRKFLKTPGTEGGYIYDMIGKMALSRPDISFRLIQNGQNKLHTSGNHNLKDVIYHVYGRDITRELIPISYQSSFFKIEGFIGKPLIARSSRAYEIYFINGRYIKSSLIHKAIEEGYRNFLMQHRFPLTVFNIIIDPEFTDVNVHPSKMELRFRNQEFLYEEVVTAVRKTLTTGELAPAFTVEAAQPQKKKQQAE
ncbi:MAG: DNA mismatch repair endonuclease MutL, partial [Lachnospiraceae bacterium]|nr:DNA mismatch repair endonuclease MutL [Lachnospiraceae bacterium]